MRLELLPPAAKLASGGLVREARHMLDHAFMTSHPPTKVPGHRQAGRRPWKPKLKWALKIVGLVAIVVAYQVYSTLITIRQILPTPRTKDFEDMYLNEADQQRCFEPGSRWHQMVNSNWSSIHDILEQDGIHPQILLKLNATARSSPSILPFKANPLLFGVNNKDGKEMQPLVVPAWMLGQHKILGYMTKMRQWFKLITVKYPLQAEKGDKESINTVFQPMRMRGELDDPINSLIAFHVDCVLRVGITPPAVGMELPSRQQIFESLRPKTKEIFKVWGFATHEYYNRVPGIAQLDVASGLDDGMTIRPITWWQRKVEAIADWLCDRFDKYCVHPEIQRARNLHVAFQYIMGNIPNKTDYYYVEQIKSQVDSSTNETGSPIANLPYQTPVRAYWHVGSNPSSRDIGEVPLQITPHGCRFPKRIYSTWMMMRSNQGSEHTLAGRVLRSMQRDPFIRKYRKSLRYLPLSRIMPRLSRVLVVVRQCISIYGEDHVFYDYAPNNTRDETSYNVRIQSRYSMMKFECTSMYANTSNQYCKDMDCEPEGCRNYISSDEW